MKTRRGVVGYLVLNMFISTLMACASTPIKESSGEYVDDSVITTKVKCLPAKDDFLKYFQIGMETYKTSFN